ncbi:uncharacterized protein LTR77_006252 [Saxophila tyrrhenica]|uniref:Nucleotide-diphospho-sugar transferase n=1 Tax=Saxophila tyrrhenica TaxID=1690608 RepID=A0AAV9P7T7_9PEZI|nr:hypothetical protein LTR77_006252 [Saxophila tyrrhenica]
MGGATFKYNDDDDHGIPILQIPSRSRSQRARLSYQRWRNPLLVIGGILFVLYFLQGGERDSTDWSRLAYVQYATDTHTLCNALMIFDSLKRLGSKADRALLYPEEWDRGSDDPEDRTTLLLKQAKRSYGAKMKPVQLLSIDGPAEPGTLKSPSDYGTSITKFRLFELEEYDRVIYFDGDSILQQHMDELFQLPPTTMAMPRAYWSDQPRDRWPLASTLMVLSPNVAETKHIYETLQWWRLQPDRDDSRHYDSDLLNDRFGSSALVLPHRPYLLQTMEFRWDDHAAYLGSYGAPASAIKWDPHVALEEAKLIHFSDWPLPKPWIMWPRDGLTEIQPSCGGSHVASCDEREIWKGLYEKFRLKRRDVCRILSVPAPQDWKQYKNDTGAL